MKYGTGYAALFINGEEVGERIRCTYLASGDKVRLNKPISFPPALRAGMAEVKVFPSATGGEWDFTIQMPSPIAPTDTVSIRPSN